ncbi:MAG: HAD family phosphatase [Deltaproteobacteria bacterium]|nr:HAD family phosphatase [Deltaproteobacteria bacterium]MCL5276221.1 HAD family phosphatase [Deltaproteobacteria bacterium]
MLDSKSLVELLEQKKLLIFDFDGTLADTSPLHARAFLKVLAPYNIKVDYQSIAGMKTKDAIKQCLIANGRNLSPNEIDTLVTAKQQYARILIKNELKPLPGVDEFLQWAKPRYRLAMYSSGSRDTINIALDKLGYTGWFVPMLCSDDVTHAKPDPEGYLMILKITGVSAKEAIVFEDSDAGIEAASYAGITIVDVRLPFRFGTIRDII